MRSALRTLLFTALLTLAAGSRAARADALAPDESPCQGNAAGAACSISGSTAPGTCQATKCARLSYAANPDGGPPLMGSAQVDCVKCLPGGSPTSGDGGPSPASSSSDGGCAVTREGARGLAPWGIALGFGALVSRLGRRKRA